MWMCDRCQSINDGDSGKCPRCGAEPVSAAERPPDYAAPPEPPGAVVPRFGHSVSDPQVTEHPVAVSAPTVDPTTGGAPYAAHTTSVGALPQANALGAGEKLAIGAGIGVLVLMLLGRLLNPVRLIFAAVGIGVIFLGHYVGHRDDAFRKSAIRVFGHVVRLDQSGSGGDSYYYSVVDFVTKDGAPMRFRDRQGARPPQNHVGDIVTVLYNPLSPTDAQIDSSLSRWLLIGMYAFGALFVFVAVAGSMTRAPAVMDGGGF